MVLEAVIEPDVSPTLGSSTAEAPTLTTDSHGGKPPLLQQPVTDPITHAAIFLVLKVNQDDGSRAAVRSLCGDLSGLLRAVGFRDLEGGLSCVMGFGSEAWDRILGDPRPGELHPFREIRQGRVTLSPPRVTCCFTSAPSAWTCASSSPRYHGGIADATLPVDEVHGFRYFDDRDIIGFVDGTENPQGALASDSTISVPRMPYSPAAATSWCRSTCTISPAGMRSRRRHRSSSSAARSCPTSSWMTR